MRRRSIAIDPACEKCRNDPGGFYCKTLDCECDCHTSERERLDVINKAYAEADRRPLIPRLKP